MQLFLVREKQFSNYMRTGINCVWTVLQHLQDFGVWLRFFSFGFGFLLFGFVGYFCLWGILFDCFLLIPIRLTC